MSKFVGNEQQEVFNYITEELGIAGSQSNKKIIAPYELDMVFPDFKKQENIVGSIGIVSIAQAKIKNIMQIKWNWQILQGIGIFGVR